MTPGPWQHAVLARHTPVTRASSTRYGACPGCGVTHAQGIDHMRTRLIAAPILAASLLAVAAAAPASAKEFGTVYVDGSAYRTFGVPARVDPGTGRDPIISFTNFTQGGVAQHAPGDGSHGGRWAVFMATWTNPANAHLVTDYNDALALAAAGQLTIVRAPNADFRCPLLPGNANGTAS